MVEIKKSLFKEIDKDNVIPVILDGEKECQHIALIYSQYVHKYSGRGAFFITSKMSEEKKEKRFAQLRKLIQIAADLGVPEEVYIKAQFEQQMKWLEPRGLKYVPFANLITERAVEEFEKYKERIDGSYSDRTAKKEFYSTQALDVRKAVEDSIAKLYYRLLAVKKYKGEVTIALAQTELETMAKAGMISNIYLYVSALASPSDSEYLTDKWKEADRKLSSFDKTAAAKIKKEVLGNFDDKEIAKWI
jgi:hypothetical protein